MSKFAQIEVLREGLQSLNQGNAGFVSTYDKPIMDRAFFPGGNGLFLGEDAQKFPVHGNLILGSNFGADEKFCTPGGKLLCLDETKNPGAWNGLRKRFSRPELEDSFFTNAWPFLHKGKSNNPTAQDKEKWLRDKVLRGSCIAFFMLTIEQVKPSLIVALGTAPAAFLSEVFPGPLGKWRANKWSGIDEVPRAIVAFDLYSAVCTAITHPSMSNAHCRVEKFRGKDRELELLHQALAAARRIKVDREQRFA